MTCAGLPGVQRWRSPWAPCLAAGRSLRPGSCLPAEAPVWAVWPQGPHRAHPVLRLPRQVRHGRPRRHLPAVEWRGLPALQDHPHQRVLDHRRAVHAALAQAGVRVRGPRHLLLRRQPGLLRAHGPHLRLGLYGRAAVPHRREPGRRGAAGVRRQQGRRHHAAVRLARVAAARPHLHGGAPGGAGPAAGRPAARSAGPGRHTRPCGVASGCPERSTTCRPPEPPPAAHLCRTTGSSTRSTQTGSARCG